ncbi:MAG TPA: SdrD B-like domain-containing protein, partial [Phototrophicaceae bacterium]|nr:SdrD B-like domain-containing protein [Phototrophicaceae bacterium]
LPSDQYQFSPQDQGDDSQDSDADFSTGKTDQTHLLSGVNDLTWDAGLVPLASIGDRVWIDINNNGVQDSGEDNYEGATVNLLDQDGNVIDTTTTDVNGNYLFDKLSPGQYGIQVVLPAHYQFSPQDQGGDDGKDSDVDFSTGKTVITTLDPDEHDLTWDAGIVPLVNIGNYVWVDIDNNGVQDGGEAGLPGVTVNLLDQDGNVISSQTTDVNGNYQFTDLPPGQYRIEVVLPDNYQFSPQDASGSDQTDSDVDFSTGRTILFTEAPGTDDDTRDAGLVPLASIGDFVWRDNNGDGIQDGGEPGIPGVTVTLYNSHGVVATQQTDSTGHYLFDLLPPGDYFIEVTAPTGYIHSPQDQGSDDGQDSDVDTTTGRSNPTTLSPAENDLTWDAGLAPLATIGDRVWVDANTNGIQDSNEQGMKGVRVNLLDGLGNLLKSTTTDTQGNYTFENLLPGSYIVQVVLPKGYRFTTPDQGSDDTVDSDVNTSTGRTPVTTLDYGEIDLTWDAGIVLVPSAGALGTLGDTVWLDRNRNGVQDAGEPGIPNATVTLTLPGGTTVTTVTDSNGKYLFTGLFPGDYTVTVDLNSLPSGLQQTYDLDGTLDSQTTVTLTSGEIFLDADFGYVSPTAINPTGAPTTPPPATGWQPVPACQRSCVDWTLYHTNQTGDWEIFRLGDPTDRPSISNNLSQGKGADDMSPSRSPNGDWIVFSSNRDGNWELYLASTDGDSTKTRRLTYNTVAIDTDPVWGPNNYVAYESTRDGNWELYLLDMTTGKTTRLTNNPASDLNPYWSTDGTKLIFQSNRSGKWQIYQLDLATGVTTRLSDGTANDVDPVYSNSSSKIAFRSYRDGDHSKSALYLMNPDGSSLQRISDVNGDATNPSWSTDDSLIAYQSNLDGDLDIYIYQVSTGITRKLTDNNTPDYAPTWLCNSTTVIFTSDVDGNPNIYSADADPIQSPAIDVKKDAAQMTTDPADDIYPENTPDEENASLEGQLPGGVSLGDQTDFLKPDASVTKADPSLDSGKAWEPINSCPTVCPAFTLYQSNRTGDQEVFRMNDTGGNDLNLSVGVGAADQGPTRSPDARWVAFTSDRDGNDDLYLVAADGSGLRRLTSDAATEDDPAWSPDSQRIAFESNRSGRWEIYTMDVQTGVVTQITSGASDNRYPDWSSAGATIAFQSNRTGGWQLYVYDLGTGTTKRLTNLPQNTTNPVYSHGSGQIAFTVQQSDGRSILYLAGQDGSNPQPISDPKGNASNPQWYSDDTLIAYQSDLDGDMDVYVYDLKTQTTRKLTSNSVADTAPTWACGKPDVIFTSYADGNDDLFRASALPITDPPLDVVKQTQQLTDNPATDNYPLGEPNKGDNTNSGDGS